MRTRVLSLGLTASLIFGCQPATSTSLSDADKQAIQATVDSALKIANTAPFDAPSYVRAYYAEDAVYMPPNEKALEGAAAMLPWFQGLPPVSNVVFTTVELTGHSDMAFVRGRYTFTITPPGAAAVVDSGKFLEVWKKRPDGSWRSWRDAFNSDLPVAPAPSPPAK